MPAGGSLATPLATHQNLDNVAIINNSENVGADESIS